jgi:chromosome segregation ATPase
VGEKVSNIETFVKNLKLKKVPFGGFETEAVYAAMKELTAMYLDEMAQLRSEKSQLENDYKTAVSRLNKTDREIERLKYQLEEAQKSQYQCAQKYKTFSLALDTLNADKEEILNKAKKEAEEIVAKASEQYRLANEEYVARKRQMDLISENISHIKQRFGMTLDSVHSILSNLLLQVEEVRKSDFELQCDDENELIEKIAGSAKQNAS